MRPTALCSQNTGVQAGVTPRNDANPVDAATMTTVKIDQSTIRAGGSNQATNALTRSQTPLLMSLLFVLQK
jgi:hypothetical protein